jgi:flagellar biosynthesis protein
MASVTESGREGPKRAVALRYERQRDPAPRVVAAGGGALAERILEVAKRHGVPVREDPDLLQLLGACEPFEEIPVEVYSAVAELLAWLWHANELSADPRR